MSNKQKANADVNDVLDNSAPATKAETTAPEADVNIVDAAIEAATNGQDDLAVKATEYTPEQLERFRKLFIIQTLPNFGTDKAVAIQKLKDWGKARTEDGLAFLVGKGSSIVNYAFGLVLNPDEMSDNSSDDGAIKVSFKATTGIERTVRACLEAMATESTKTMEKTWWSDTAKGFKAVVNGVGKLPDGAPTSTVTTGSVSLKTVDTSGRIKRAMGLIVRCATHLKNGRISDALHIYLILLGKIAQSDGTVDFYFSAPDLVASIQCRLEGLARREAYDLAAVYEKDIKAGKSKVIKDGQEQAQSERDAEELEKLKESLQRQRAHVPGSAPSQPVPTSVEFITWHITIDKDGNELERVEAYRGLDNTQAAQAKFTDEKTVSRIERVYTYSDGSSKTL